MITITGFSPFGDSDQTAIDRPPVTASDSMSAFVNLLAKCVARISEQPHPKQGAQAPQSGRNTATGIDTLSAGGTGTMQAALRFVLDHEGSGYVAADGNESSRYGIRQSTAERFGYQGSVKDMSRTQAEAIYTKLWAESGAQALPPRLAIVHFDTYMNSPAAARKILRTSGGDTDTYLRMRSERYSRLGRMRPERYARYMKGWMNRVHDLQAMAATGPPATKAPI